MSVRNIGNAGRNCMVTASPSRPDMERWVRQHDAFQETGFGIAVSSAKRAEIDSQSLCTTGC